MKLKATVSYGALPGIIFMLFNTLSLAGHDILAKILRSQLSAAMIVFLYKFSLLIILLPWILNKGWGQLKTKKMPFYLLRALFSSAGSLCFIYGLKGVPLASASALQNVEHILVLIFGAIIFKEKLTWLKVCAIIFGFTGAFLVVNPSLNTAALNLPYSDYHYILYTIAAVILWSANTIITKILSNTENTETQMFYLLLFSSIIAFPLALIDFSSLMIIDYRITIQPYFNSVQDVWAIIASHSIIQPLLLMAFCYLVHGISYFNALKSELSVVIPFAYARLPFSIFLGYVFFNEVKMMSAYVGCALIIIACLILIKRETVKVAAS